MEDGDAGFDVDGCFVFEEGEFFCEFVGEYGVAEGVDFFGGGHLFDVLLLFEESAFLLVAFPLGLLVEGLVVHAQLITKFY